jgi:hypothetical protein
MLSDEDRAWLEFREAVNVRIKAEEAAAEAERDAQEARLHEEWLVTRRAAAEQTAAARHRALADETVRLPPPSGGESSVLAEADPLHAGLKAALGLWVIHQISGWPWRSERSC